MYGVGVDDAPTQWLWYANDIAIEWDRTKKVKGGHPNQCLNYNAIDWKNTLEFACCCGFVAFAFITKICKLFGLQHLQRNCHVSNTKINSGISLCILFRLCRLFVCLLLLDVVGKESLYKSNLIQMHINVIMKCPQKTTDSTGETHTFSRPTTQSTTLNG